jgi:hypothetical protein
MKRPNPLPPHMMQPAERRRELCGLLALGLIRLRMRADGRNSAGGGDIPLHNSGDQSGHATPTHKETA